MIQFEIVPIEKSEDINIILGQAHFIKTVEDLHEVVVQASGAARFGVAFCESSGPRLIRRSGNDEVLVRLAVDNMRSIGAGHSFIVVLRGIYPVSLLNSIKMVPEVCRVFCATANPVQVLVGVTERGRAIVGVVDGEPPLGEEAATDVESRKSLLRRIGYKL
jgi:adenosine/AMP kinase